jgi:uridine kinase
MIGERLIIVKEQREAAGHIWKVLQEPIRQRDRVVAIAVAGESGAGKSGVAYCLAMQLIDEGIPCVLLSQDDYFRLPPKSNHHQRLLDSEWVGPKEVQLDLLDSHIRACKEPGNMGLTKPLIHFDENRVSHEWLPPLWAGVVLVEGTYVTALPSVDYRVFIDRDYHTTRDQRQARGRDPNGEFVEQVLAREQGIIARHKSLADLVWSPATQVGRAPQARAHNNPILSGGITMVKQSDRAEMERRTLAQQWARLSDELHLGDSCSVEVERDGNWFVLRGWVDCHTTKGHLFALVPLVDGAQWIVDRIRVGGPDLEQLKRPSLTEPSQELIVGLA